MIDKKVKFEKEYTVNAQHTDINGNVEFPYIYNILQETASFQLSTYYDSLEYLKTFGKAYVILRIDILLNRNIKQNENIKVFTWQHKKTPVKLYRNYKIEDGEGKLICEASSMWTYFDLQTRRPLPSKEIINPVIDFDEQVNADSFVKVSNLNNGTLIGTKIITNQDIDLYQHMNNAKYINLIFDFLPNLNNIKKFKIDFINECKLGDELKIFLEQENEKYKLCGMKNDGSISFNSEIITEV